MWVRIPGRIRYGGRAPSAKELRACQHDVIPGGVRGNVIHQGGDVVQIREYSTRQGVT